MTPDSGPHAPRRARRAFWGLVIVAVLAAGGLSASINSSAGPRTGLLLATSGLVLIAAVALAARVLFAIQRAQQHASRVSPRPSDGPS